MEEKPKRKWAGTTMGNEWMHETLIKILRHVDVRVIYIFTFIFVIPVCLIMLPSKKTAYRYFHKRQNYGKIRSAWATYKNHCLFATNVIDKFAMYAGKKFDVKMEGFDHFKELDARRGLRPTQFTHRQLRDCRLFTLDREENHARLSLRGRESLSDERA